MGWVIIGYGSMLHSDDRVGCIVADQVRSQASALDVEVMCGHQLMPEWTEPISRADGVIFVDAGAGMSAGQVLCTLLHASTPAAPAMGVFTHYPTPQTLLDGAHALYGRAPEAWLYCVGGVNFELGEALSGTVRQAVPRVVALILEKVQTPCMNSV